MFEEKYKYTKFAINCYLVGSAAEIAKYLTYAQVKQWLITNKHKLFGYYISSVLDCAPAEHFLRYETNIK